MTMRKLGVLFVLLSLLAGFIIYPLTRTESVLLNQWLSRIGNGEILHYFQSLPWYLPRWIKYSLPDALWMLALTILILIIWDFRLHKKSITWLAMAIGAGIMFEVLQGFHFINGTFDPVDLVLILFAAIIPISSVILISMTWRLYKPLEH